MLLNIATMRTAGCILDCNIQSEVKTTILGNKTDNFAIYAILIIAITGMVKISVLTIHHFESASPLNRPFSALIAVNSAPIAHRKAMTSANSPRVLHPRRPTGDKATAKKSADINTG